MSPKNDEAGDVYQLENWIAKTRPRQLQYYFKYCYIAINRANTVIDHIQNSSGLSRAMARRRNSRRSLFPACMELFQSGAHVRHRARADKDGGGAIANNASGSLGLDQLYDLILGDLTRADNLLEVNKVFGRADKVAAQSLMAKAYLTIASSKERSPLYRDAP